MAEGENGGRWIYSTILMFMSRFPTPQWLEADVFSVDFSPVNFQHGDGFMGLSKSTA